MSETKFIFILGGVVSSLGKGITASSVASLLKLQGFKVKNRKIDPYLNIDAGTMNPEEHGEVFVTEDGAEVDLDFGYYERFTQIMTKKEDSITAGKVYHELLTKERRGDYLGDTVQIVPHATEIIKNLITFDKEKYDFIICEVGGTVGDIESLPFLEAIRQLKHDLDENKTLFIHLTLTPYLKTSGEVKTKPTQHSVKQLQSFGIFPNIIICRTEKEISQNEIKKISLFCNIETSAIIQGLNEENIYNIPISYHKQNLDKQICLYFKLPYKSPDFTSWFNILVSSKKTKEIIIAIVAKYTILEDSYKSIIESLNHACIGREIKIKIKWVYPEESENKFIAELKECHGILVPGGFGMRGIKDKMLAIEYARKNQIPFFGICLGMQLAVIEFAKNVLKLPNPNSLEFTQDCLPVFQSINTIIKKNNLENLFTTKDNLGGTMRLGHYKCKLQKDSKIAKIYGKDIILERHRHRYEFNNDLLDKFKNSELLFTGISDKGNLLETIELKNHPWFIACQFHPEFQSSPQNVHPLFLSFVKSASMITLNNKQLQDL